MPMRWEDERYVRIYTRDTTTMRMLPWQSRAVFFELLRKVDRAGILDVGDDGYDALAVTFGYPLELIEQGMPELIKRGVVLYRPLEGVIVVPNFIEAQEARASDNARRRRSRERARDKAAAIERGLLRGDGTVPKRDSDVPKRDASATRGPARSRAVTPSLAMPSQADSSGGRGRTRRSPLAKAAPKKTESEAACDRLLGVYREQYATATGAQPVVDGRAHSGARALLLRLGGDVDRASEAITRGIEQGIHELHAIASRVNDVMAPRSRTRARDPIVEPPASATRTNIAHELADEAEARRAVRKRLSRDEQLIEAERIEALLRAVGSP